MRSVTVYVMDADEVPVEDMIEDFLRTKGIECATESEYYEWADANSEEELT